MKKLTQDQLNKIEDYNSDSITTLEDFMEAVRRTIGQYLGYKGWRGWRNGARELIQNGLDECMDIGSFADTVWVYFNEMDQRIKVRDNGRGIPFEDIERIYASQHTSKNYEKQAGNYSSGTHGIGAKATNAVSKEFIATSHRAGECKTVVFNNGLPVKVGKVKKDTSGLQGTEVECIPHECMDNPDLTCEKILELLNSIVPLYKKGITVHFEGIRQNGEMLKQTIVNQDGLLTYLVNQTTNPLMTPVVMGGDTGQVKAEIAFTYDAVELYSDAKIDSFANYCPTTGGAHVDGFINGICNYFRNYMNKIYLSSDKKSKSKNKKKTEELRILNSDIKAGLRAVVHGLALYPIFGGQAKETLTNEEMQEYLETNIPIWLDEWTKKYPKEFSKLCKYFKENANIRMNTNKQVEKIVAKYETNKLTGFPDKFLPPNDWDSDQLELIIAEGDSAIGTYKNTRNSKTQGLFPIRGKFLNVIKATLQKMLDNMECQAIINIIGGGWGKNFDISKVKWRRVIIATDADIDGYHIRTLLMKFFLKYMPDLVVQGRVYLAIPPLYGVRQKSGKINYFKNKIDFVKWVEKSFIKQNQICYSDNRTINENDLLRILYDNYEYVEEMNKIAYTLDPTFLEFVLHNRHLDTKNLNKTIKKYYRFLEGITEEFGTRVIRCLVNQKMQVIFLNDRFLNQCSNVLKYIDEGYNTYKFNGFEVGLYGLMKAFYDFSPRVIRYKGLGEMNADQLAESTLYPSPTRQLMQYTVRDLSDDLNKIRDLESNKQRLLIDIAS